VGDGASAAADQDGMDAAIAAMIASRSNEPLGIFGPLEYQNGIVLEPGIYDAGDLPSTTVRCVSLPAFHGQW
jgi:hypothetical protein